MGGKFCIAALGFGLLPGCFPFVLFGDYGSLGIQAEPVVAHVFEDVGENTFLQYWAFLPLPTHDVRAIDDGYVLVTNNTTDFTSLLRREKVHAGLVCLNVAPGLMSLDVQKRLFALALDRLGDSEPINELLEITLMENRSVWIERYDLPRAK